jgi:hypothetical protein
MSEQTSIVLQEKVNGTEYQGFIRKSEGNFLASIVEIPEKDAPSPFIFSVSENFSDSESAENFIATEWTKILNQA